MRPVVDPHPQSLLGHLGRVPDRRRRQGRRYPLAGVLGMLVLGALHGESSLRGMWLWARARWGRLWAPLGFWSPAPPGLSTVWTIAAGVPAEEVEAVLAAWAETRPELADGWLSVDGKALRGSRRGERGALRVVAAVGHDRRAVLRQRPSRAGREEADALALLRALPLRGRVVTLDAGLLKRPQVRAILAGGGDYLGVLKGNGPEVEAAVAEWLRGELSPPRPAAPARRRRGRQGPRAPGAAGAVGGPQ
jgi:hypothetical protein